MPTYEYQCQSCGGVMEVFQSITARPLRKAVCESCGDTRKVRRLIGTGGAVLFKGSGFYQTDYRSEKYKKAAKSESESAKPKKAADKSADADKAKPAKSETPSKPGKSEAKAATTS